MYVYVRVVCVYLIPLITVLKSLSKPFIINFNCPLKTKSQIHIRDI